MSTAVPPTPPADRYGRASSGLSRGAKVAVVLALAAAVALAAWFAVVQHQRDPVQADVVSFRVTSAEEIEIDFQVSMPPGTTAVCTVGALSKSFAEVGSMRVPVGPSESGTARYTVTLRTSQLADAGVVDGCTRG
ncbi:DUF4307 domain-containing protein [Xylanimonas allomyrinae]|uniref:DUF4307 domain-containing protein n=1 Tax=Xylanimonas allomyrinae TaxID=2509459 RepID=A0A4P6EHP2_9MICO|nr:DUF4307 domain-containing protein [Xylanimonas allomyrinae]QAY62002.1 DUF4307 domain-containing protein [Xylanimonas allomyrinae]